MTAPALLDGGVRAAILALVTTYVYAEGVRFPVPDTWSLGMSVAVGLVISAVLGILARLWCRDPWVVVAGSTAGFIFGANRSCISDISLSWWQRVECGLMLPYAIAWWAFVVSGWALAHLTKARILKARAVA